MNKLVLLYVGPVRLLNGWLAEQMRLCAGNGAKNLANQLVHMQKKSHVNGGRNWK